MTITASLTTKQLPTYVGQTWYDFMGNVIEETGHNSPQAAAERIQSADKALIGRWCFALVKIKVVEGGVEKWVNNILFPDGKTRRLQQGEVSVSQASKGQFITIDGVKESAKAARLRLDIRAAPDTRFPWKGDAVETKLERFNNMVELEKWLIANQKEGAALFVFTPARQIRPPDEEKLFAYLAFVAL